MKAISSLINFFISLSYSFIPVRLLLFLHLIQKFLKSKGIQKSGTIFCIIPNTIVIWITIQFANTALILVLVGTSSKNKGRCPI